jgi:hypothetical protein
VLFTWEQPVGPLRPLSASAFCTMVRVQEVAGYTGNGLKPCFVEAP